MKKSTKKMIVALALIVGLIGVGTSGIVPLIDPPFPTVMQMVVQMMGK